MNKLQDHAKSLNASTSPTITSLAHAKASFHDCMETEVLTNGAGHWRLCLEIEDILKVDLIIHVHDRLEAREGRGQPWKALELRQNLTFHLRLERRVKAVNEGLGHHLLLLATTTVIKEELLDWMASCNTAAALGTRF